MNDDRNPDPLSVIGVVLFISALCGLLSIYAAFSQH